MAEFMRVDPLRPVGWTGVTVPALILCGGKTEPALRKAARAIADVLPDAEHRELPGHRAARARRSRIPHR
jgi:hypothetical protein